MTRARDTFIGPYRVEIKIGDGGMGVVYKCFDPKLKRFVALKVLKDKFAGDARQEERFHREAQAIASVSHPNIAQIHSIEDQNGLPPYLVMEYVEGSSAEAILKAQGAMDPGRAAGLVREAALGLRAAFQKGIVHRDVKPSNILLSSDGAVKIVDFGLAKVVEGTHSITEEGMVLGTPHYISPEQGRGQKADHRSDIYSLGATFYHLVTGRPPFEADTQVGVIVAHLNETPRPPHELRGEVPVGVSLVVGKMMAKEPGRRYQEYQELLDDLDRLARGEPVSAATAAVGLSTFRPAARPARAGFYWAVGAAAALALCLLLVLSESLRPGALGARRDLARLGPWYEAEDKRGFNLLFRSLPEKLSRAEAVHLLFLTWPKDAGQIALEGPRLVLRDLAMPVALRFPFRRLDELHLKGLKPTEDRLDLGVALVHPDGDSLRALHFKLRWGGELREPVQAIRDGDPVLPPSVALRPPVMKGLKGGEHDVEIHLRQEEDRVRLRFLVRSAGRGGQVVYSSGDEWLEFPGRDWNSGVLCLLIRSPEWPAWSSLQGGSLALGVGGILAWGLVDDGRAVEACPWDPKDAPERLAGSAPPGRS